MKVFIGCSLMFLIVFSGQTQESIHQKNDLFFYWGYNRAAYTKSDFHISGEGYNLTFKDVKAEDYVTTFSLPGYFKPENITIPQYVARIGMYINDRISVSVGIDHMKYYMILRQELDIEGEISKEASAEFSGTYDNSNQLVPVRFLYFHHSDGLNYSSAELEYNYPIWQSTNKKYSWEVSGNVGLGVVVPKTYVMIIGNAEDNKFHLAGGGVSAKVGTRFNFLKYAYIEASTKNGYVWMPRILVNNDNNATASQHFGWTQFFGALGFNIPLNRKQKDDAENP